MNMFNADIGPRDQHPREHEILDIGKQMAKKDATILRLCALLREALQGLYAAASEDDELKSCITAELGDENVKG